MAIKPDIQMVGEMFTYMARNSISVDGKIIIMEKMLEVNEDFSPAQRQALEYVIEFWKMVQERNIEGILLFDPEEHLPDGEKV